jgi:hypothetical protein
MKRKNRSGLRGATIPSSRGWLGREEDVDIFVDMLDRIVRSDYRGRYAIDPVTGMYAAEGYEVDAAKHFGYRKGRRLPGEQGEAA